MDGLEAEAALCIDREECFDHDCPTSVTKEAFLALPTY